MLCSEASLAEHRNDQLDQLIEQYFQSQPPPLFSVKKDNVNKVDFATTQRFLTHNHNYLKPSAKKLDKLP